MRTRAADGVTLLLVLGLAGCMKPNPYAEDLADDDAADPNGDGDGDGDDDDDDDDDDDATETETDGSSDTDPSPLPDLGDTGGSCDASLGAPAACEACLVESCCVALSDCVSDADCSCLAACLLDGSSQGLCKSQCGAKPDETPLLDPVLDCSASACADAC